MTDWAARPRRRPLVVRRGAVLSLAPGGFACGSRNPVRRAPAGASLALALGCALACAFPASAHGGENATPAGPRVPTQSQQAESQTLAFPPGGSGRQGAAARQSSATPPSADAAPASRVDGQPAPSGPLEQRRPGASAGAKLFWVVVYLILLGGGLWVGLACFKKYVPGSKKFFNHPALEVLGRTQIDARRYLTLVRVGRRLLVVGISPDGLHTLTEIGDAEEVTEIMETARPQTEAGKNVFVNLFRTQFHKAQAEEQAADTAVRAAALENNVSDIRERVRSLREEE